MSAYCVVDVATGLAWLGVWDWHDATILKYTFGIRRWVLAGPTCGITARENYCTFNTT